MELYGSVGWTEYTQASARRTGLVEDGRFGEGARFGTGGGFDFDFGFDFGFGFGFGASFASSSDSDSGAGRGSDSAAGGSSVRGAR